MTYQPAAPASNAHSIPASQQLITDKLPAWLVGAAPDAHQNMRKTLKSRGAWLTFPHQAEPGLARLLIDEFGEHRQAEKEVRALLAPLPGLYPFASQLLTSAIKEHFKLDLDVSHTYLLNMPKAKAYKEALSGDPLATSNRALKLATQSLLHSAMQNFEAAEAQNAGLEVDGLQSAVLESNDVSIVSDAQPIELVPEAFATLARELDIGGQYQALIDTILPPAAGSSQYAGKVWATFRRAEQCTFRLHVHQACLSKAIDPQIHELLLALANDRQVEYQGKALMCSHMRLLNVTLSGALVIGAVTDATLSGRHPPLEFPFYGGLVITYMPGAAIPLKAHASRHDAELFIRDQLSTLTASALVNLIPAEAKSRFDGALQDRLRPYTWNPEKGLYERTPDPTAVVSLHVQPFTRPLFDELVSQKRQRMKSDAMFHAVPTAMEDQKSADKRLAYFEQLAFTALNVGAFFVPGLGQLMLGLSAVMLSCEVFEGIESWADGDRKQALDYLMDVVENVALIGAFGAAGAANLTPAVERIPVETPSFIEELEPVVMPDGTNRLWHPDLQPFAHDVILPAGLQADEFGLYHHDGKTWLALDGNVHAVRQAPENGEFRVLHPSKAHSYEPPLRHNGAGAWLHPADQPGHWQELQLFRRAGHLSGQFDDETARRILRASGTEENVLRRTLSENQRLPAQLEDSMTRFQLYRMLEQSPELTEPSQLQAAFEKRYRELPSHPSGGAEVIQSRYPQLPPPVTEELLRHASPLELDDLSAGKVPMRIAEEVRSLQQQVRLNRAYEGLYLESLRNWDTDVLILHTFEQLPGSSPDISITLEQRQYSPLQIDSIGVSGGPGHTSILSTRAGYAVIDSDTPEEPLSVHDSLQGALFEMLTPTQRELLGIESELGLKHLIQHAPLLPRAALRKALRMQGVPNGWRSPMRLADGRLGYPLGGTRTRATSISRHTLLNTIRQIGQHAPATRPAEHILTALENRNLTRAQIDDTLRALLEQRNQLRNRLAEWREMSAPMPHHTADGIERLMNTFSQYWYDRAFLTPSDITPPLRLERLSLAEFPLALPDFFTASVTDLQLIETLPEDFAGWHQHRPQLNSLLEQFANLRSLEVSRAYHPEASPSAFQFSLPEIVQHLPALESLSLTNQNILLSAVDIESLAQLTRLRRLDLSGNRLSGNFPPISNELELDYIGLDNMALEQWPQWLGEDTVTRVRHIALRNNHIRNLPRFLRDNRINIANHAVISLQGNEIAENDVLSVVLAEDGRADHFEMDLSQDLRARLALLQEQRQQLRDFIDNYVNASSSSAPVSQAMMASRTRVATALNEFWHYQEIGLTRAALRLNGLPLEHFPTRLPAFFTSQVHNLVLEGVSGSTAQLDSVLRQFTQVTRLTVDDYRQAEQTLPSALLRLPRLSDIAWRQSGLVIDQNMIDTLGRVPGLDSLDLTGNRMGVITQVPETLQRLRRLDMTSMGLTQWPAWVDSLFPLEVLDLSDNLLADLPEHILANLGNDFPITSIRLLGNPLSQETVMRARTFSDSQLSYTFAIDLSDSASYTSESSTENMMGGHFHLPFLDPDADAPNVNDWLLASDVENDAMRDCWEQLQTSGDAGNLLALVGRLRSAAPYQNRKSRVSFCERVRKVLVSAAVNPDDLALFNQQANEALPQANGDQTCHDGALLVFQNIELYLANQRLQIDAADTDGNLYRELRRLYRLQALDDVAKSETANRDEAEVRLTYRRELNTSLDLGQPDDTLRYAINASIEELTYAELQVQRGELGEEFLNFAASNERWVQHLRQAYADRFADIEQTYQRQVNELPDRYPDRPLDTLEEEFKALEQSKKAREWRLIRELTSFANPDRRPRHSTE